MRYIKDDDNISIYDRFLTPEESLIVALIENAVIEANSNSPKIKRYMKQNAKNWLNSNNTSPFSFNWCLAELHLDNISKTNIIKNILHYREEIK